MTKNIDENKSAECEERQTDPDKCCWYFDPSYNRFTTGTLLLVSAFIYYCTYNVPGSFQTIIQTIFSIPPYKFEYLYSFYSLPNSILCLFGGMLIDRVFGLELGSIVFVLIGLIGQAVFTVGGFTRLYWLMLVGRVIFGIGMESLSVALNCFIVEWFKGEESNIVFGLFQSMTRVGSSIVFMIGVPSYLYFEKRVPEEYLLGVALTPYFGMIVIQLILVLALVYFTKINDNHEAEFSSKPPSIKITHILHFPLTCWLIIIMLSVCNNALYAFVSCSQQLLQNCYGVTIEEADKLSSFMNLFAAIISPLPGFLVYKLGKELTFNLVGLSIAILSQIIMAETDWNPYIPLTLLAIGITVVNICSWSLVPITVEPYQLATAYGVLQSLINLVGSLFSVFVGYLLGSYGPLQVILLFIASFIFGFACIALTIILDRRGNGLLNASPLQKQTFKLSLNAV